MKPLYFFLGLSVLLLYIYGCATTKGDAFKNTVSADDKGNKREAVTPEPDYSTAIPYSSPLPTPVLHESGETNDSEPAVTRAKGFIDVSVKPDNAMIIFDFLSVHAGMSKVSVGKHTIRARLFGYAEQEKTVDIQEGAITTVEFELQVAAFSISLFKVSNKIFNPEDHSPFGKTVISFAVNAPGLGHLSVKNEKAEKVFGYEFREFGTFHQSVSWDGKSGDGFFLADGRYSIELVGEDIDGKNRSSAFANVTIDRTNQRRYQSVFNGVSGLLFCPRVVMLPEHDWQFSSIFVMHGENIDGELFTRAPSAFSYRSGLTENLELDLLAGLVFTNYESMPMLFSAAVKYRYLDAGEVSRIRGGIFTRLAIHSGTGTDTYSNYTGLSIGFPFESEIGFVTVMLCPEFVASPWRVTGAPDWVDTFGLHVWSYFRAGLSFTIGNFSIGTSAALRTRPFSDGFVLDLPMRGGLEFNYKIPETSVNLNAAMAIEYENTESYFLSGGVGIAFFGEN